MPRTNICADDPPDEDPMDIYIEEILQRTEGKQRPFRQVLAVCENGRTIPGAVSPAGVGA